MSSPKSEDGPLGCVGACHRLSELLDSTKASLLSESLENWSILTAWKHCLDPGNCAGACSVVMSSWGLALISRVNLQSLDAIRA